MIYSKTFPQDIKKNIKRKPMKLRWTYTFGNAQS